MVKSVKTHSLFSLFCVIKHRLSFQNALKNVDQQAESQFGTMVVKATFLLTESTEIAMTCNHRKGCASIVSS